MVTQYEYTERLKNLAARILAIKCNLETIKSRSCERDFTLDPDVSDIATHVAGLETRMGLMETDMTNLLNFTQKGDQS